jgi:hypothetical protein
MFSELRGFNAGLRMFAFGRRSRNVKDKEDLPPELNTRNPRVIAARRNMIYKPSKYQVYEKVKEGDKKWLAICRLAYPDVYNQGYEFYAMQNAAKLI